MNEERGEELSALLDGELSGSTGERALDRLLGDEHMRERWRRYHLIADAMRGEGVPGTGPALAERVRDAVATEPTVLAPRRAPRRYLRPAVGIALAASVTTLAVLGGHVFGNRAGGAPVASVSPAAVEGASLGPVRAASVPVAQTLPLPTMRQTRLQWSVTRPAVQARLNAYLVNYSESLGNGMRGMLPYARVVGYDAGSR